jgi:hypothetical protein
MQINLLSPTRVLRELTFLPPASIPFFNVKPGPDPVPDPDPVDTENFEKN